MITVAGFNDLCAIFHASKANLVMEAYESLEWTQETSKISAYAPAELNIKISELPLNAMV